MSERPAIRIVYHPAPTPRPDGAVSAPAPIRLPGDLPGAAAWLRRRLALSGLDGAARYSGEPLALDEAALAAATTTSRAATPGRFARPAAASGLMASLAEMINEDEESELPYADPLSAPPVDPGAVARQAADDPFGALLGEAPRNTREEEEGSANPFRDLLG